MKKSAIITAFILSTFFCSSVYAQEKHISGNIYIETYGQTEDGEFGKIKVDKVKIFLTGYTDGSATGVLKYETNDSFFDFILSEQELVKYNALEFQSYSGDKIISIDSIKDDSIIVILDKMQIMKKPAIYLYPSVL